MLCRLVVQSVQQASSRASRLANSWRSHAVHSCPQTARYLAQGGCQYHVSHVFIWNLVRQRGEKGQDGSATSPRRKLLFALTVR